MACSRSAPACPPLACAVQRRRFPVGASPTRQPLQPEAIGAVMEVTKWLKPSISVSRIGGSASVQAATRVNVEQASKRTMCRPTRIGEESVRNTGSPKAWSAVTNRKPVRDRLGALGWRRGSYYRGSRVTPVEGRDLSSRQTQYVVKDLEIGKPINSNKCSEAADGVTREGVKSCPRAGCGKSACPVR